MSHSVAYDSSLTQAPLPKPPADIPQKATISSVSSPSVVRAPELDPETAEALRVASVKAREITVRLNYFAHS
jgi:hypothetical protein